MGEETDLALASAKCMETISSTVFNGINAILSADAGFFSGSFLSDAAFFSGSFLSDAAFFSGSFLSDVRFSSGSCFSDFWKYIKHGN